ncbi:hypothetical protein OHA72_43750 [Dactylosporangium sp. NBC_01737]|uniref:hypothetical protein n=1 Tax=Dactylosporangium sp. NBC_01737 TaxID=2975959 RepID=UPI002E0DD659|nr:hypothetical protein OHA72_43750 [Dactylosporangium sp. NBC_01737]
MGLFKRRALPPAERLMAAAGLPTGGGAVPMMDLVMEVAPRRNARITAVLAVVEDLLAQPGDAQIVALKFIENLQNAASHGTDGLLTVEELLPMCGPRTVEGWETANRFWAAVVAWCDANGQQLETSASLDVVQHQGLRSLLWPTTRRLPDGRRVDLSHVLLYEKATGTPITAFTP